MISGLTIVYMSAVDWSAPWHGPQELAKRFGAAGNRVLYVEPVGWRRPRAFDVPRLVGRIRRAATSRGARGSGSPLADGVELIAPILIPGARSKIARAINRRLMLRTLRGRLGASRPLVLWIYTPAPVTNDLVGQLGEDLCIYHCTQHHAGRPLAPLGTAQVERALISKADLVIADGILLYRERERLHDHIYRIPSGVDLDSQVEASTAQWADTLGRPLIGYMGTIDHRIDPNLIAHAARAHPEWSFAVVGPVVDIDVSELAALPNVTLTGPLPFSEVPGALAAFDVSLMPYADIEMTRYTYPAKLHQYLAAGLPIVSVPLPDLDEFSGFARQAATPAEFVAEIDHALHEPRMEAERRAVAAENTWAARAEAASAVIEAHLAGAPPASSADYQA